VDQTVVIETTTRQQRLNDEFERVLRNYRDAAQTLNIMEMIGSLDEKRQARAKYDDAQAALDRTEDLMWEEDNRDRHETDEEF
jgi:hypothetical protein